MAYANSADPDQTAPEGAVWSVSSLLAIQLSILRKLHKKQNLNENKKSTGSDVAPAGIKSYKFLFVLKKIYFAVFKKLMG